MNEEKVTIWGRELTLGVVYDCYQGETPLLAQEEALAQLLCSWSVVEEARPAVEAYCRRVDGERFGDAVITNLFKYVMPREIFLKRTADGNRVAALMCDYRFDEDNGLAVVFKNERLEKIGTQNIIL